MSKKQRIIVTLVLFSLYAIWEANAEGNIRIDIIIIYPILFILYAATWWKEYKWKALFISFILSAFQYGFMILSYPLFNKYYG
ncbi:MAG: hypothetical protein GY909_10820 [Oligoflexia bacterium]|nr:hypothetical protein [Oligoflexia bacterium]